MKRRKLFSTIGINILAWALSIVLLAPLLLILFNSFKTGKAAAEMNLALPASLEWSNFAVVIEKGKLGTTFLNSMLYSVCSVLLCTLLCTMASYVLSRNRRRLHNFLYLFLVLGIAMPINFIPLMKVMQITNLMNTRIGIILLYTATQTPFNVFLIHSFVSKISPEIDEAAVIDGASPFGLFFRIVMPLMKPVLVTVMVLTFLNTWNEFVMPLYFLGSTDKWPMTLAVYNFFGMYFKDWNLVCADIVLTSLPVIVVYLLGQKYIVSGMTAGAVKG
ncbi:MAG: carbohydrate ABC transporter permease [Clostridia bacterium]|jgi:raffinose/stachyose/melibiose transport system permease protein|nr:carbohydrate ABC transporter permease [Clostridia bacterium]